MDDKTLEAITELATKLGTTVEHLWAAVLRQAPISATVDIIFMAIWGAAIVGLMVCLKINEENIRDQETICIAWIALIAVGILYLVVVTSCIAMLVAAFVNPEYWALKQIIK